MAGAVAAGPALAWLTYGFFRNLFRGFWKGYLEAREAINVPLEVTIDAAGVSILVRRQNWFCPWHSLTIIEEDSERYYFWTSNTQAHVFPKRLLEGSEAEEFAAALRKWYGQDPISPPRLAGSKMMVWSTPNK